MTTFNNWNETQARHEQNYLDFVSACETLAPMLHEQPDACGTWSPRQVIAHLAGWYSEATRRYAEMIERPGESRYYDIDAFNAQSVAVRASLTWDDMLRDLQRWHAALMASAACLTLQTLSTTAGFAEWLDNTGEDCAFHAAQLRTWAREQSLPRL